MCFFLPFSPVMFLTGHPALIERGTSVLGGRWRGTPASFKRRAQSNILRARRERAEYVLFILLDIVETVIVSSL